MADTTLTTAYFSGGIPTDAEIDRLEAEIDQLEYCVNDILILIAEVRRVRATFRCALDLMGKIANQISPSPTIAKSKRSRKESPHADR